MSENTGLPHGWASVPLEEVVLPIGKTDPTETPFEKFIYFDIGSIDGDLGIVNNSKEIIGAQAPSRARQLVMKGDVLFSTVRPYLRAVAQVPPNEGIGVASTGFCVLRSESEISEKYIFYFVRSDFFLEKIIPLQRGVSYPAVRPKDILSQTLQLPPSVEQIRIVEKLEELFTDLDNGVAELKAAQVKLGQYRQSLLKSAVDGSLTEQWRKEHASTITETGEQLLQRILKERRERWQQQKLAEFETKGKKPPKDWQQKYPEPVPPVTTDLPELPEGWVWASIHQVSFDERYSLAIGPFGSNLKVSDYTDSGVPLVFVRNIRASKYGAGFTKYTSFEKAKELVAHAVSAGDVLVTKMGEPPGDADVFPQNQPDSIITADCIKIRCWPELILSEFLKCTINSQVVKKQIALITKGVAQKKVSLGRFSSVAVPVPSFLEQQKIVSSLESAELANEKQKKFIDYGLVQSAMQRKNILKSAFSGELVPQDPNDEPASVLLERIRKERVAYAKQKKAQTRKVRA